MGVCSVGFDAFSYVSCIRGNIFISQFEFTYSAWGSVHNIFVWNTLHSSSVVEYCGMVQWYAIWMGIRYLVYHRRGQGQTGRLSPGIKRGWPPLTSFSWEGDKMISAHSQGVKQE